MPNCGFFDGSECPSSVLTEDGDRGTATAQTSSQHRNSTNLVKTVEFFEQGVAKIKKALDLLKMR